MLAVLDPDVVFRSDAMAVPRADRRRSRRRGGGAAGRCGPGAGGAPLLVNGAVGVVVAPRGRLMMVLDFTIQNGKIIAIDAIADPERLAELELAVLDG